MRTAWVDLQGAVLEKSDGLAGGDVNGRQLIVITALYVSLWCVARLLQVPWSNIPMNDQNWNINLLKILPQICLGEDADAIVPVLEATHHALLPPAPNQSLANLGTLTVVAEERTGGNIEEELRTVCYHRGSEAIENALWCASWVAVGPEHEWRDGANQNGLASTGGSVAAKEAGYFATASRVTNHVDVLEVEVLEESEEVVAIGV